VEDLDVAGVAAGEHDREVVGHRGEPSKLTATRCGASGLVYGRDRAGRSQRGECRAMLRW
jgi:hypothetical protein